MKLLISTLLLGTVAFAAPIPKDWTNKINDSLYGNNANWSPAGVPNNTDEAIFPIPVTDPTNNLVLIDGNFTINSWLFPSTGTLDYIFTTNGSPQTYNFASTPTPDLPFINIQAGNQTVSNARGSLFTQVNNDMTITVASGASYTNTGNIIGPPGPNIDLALNGSGDFTLNGATIQKFRNVSIDDLKVFLLNNGGIDGNDLLAINSGVVTNSSSLGINSNGNVTIFGGTINNAGTISVSNNFLIEGGTVNNFAGGIIDRFTDLNIAGGRLNNFQGASIFTIPLLQITGGTLYNETNITSGIGTFQITSGTYEVGVVNSSDRGFIEAKTIALGANLLVDILPGFNVGVGQDVLILQAANPINSRFAHVATDTPAVRVKAIYDIDPDQVYLEFFPALPNNFLFGQLQEPLFASVDHINFRIERELVKLRNRRCGCGCPGNFFAGYIGSQGSLENRFFDLDYFSNGFWFGADYLCNNWGFGASINYEKIESNHRRDFTIDFVHGDLFGTFIPTCLPCLAFEAILGFGNQWWDFNRRIDVAGIDFAHAHTEAFEWDILFGAEYAWNWGCNLMTVPYFTVQYARLGIDSFRERGAGFFNFRTDDRDVDSCRSVLGLRFLGNYCFCGTTFLPEIDLGWEHEYLDDQSFFIEPVGSPEFGGRVRFDRDFRDYLLFAADFTFEWCNRYGLEVSYDLEWNSRFHNHTYYVGGNVRF